MVAINGAIRKLGEQSQCEHRMVSLSFSRLIVLAAVCVQLNAFFASRGGGRFRFVCCTMAPHLVKAELDKVLQLAGDGKTPSETHRFIAARRAKKRIYPHVIEVIRLVVAGSTFRRGAKETRGRKRKWTTDDRKNSKNSK